MLLVPSLREQAQKISQTLFRMARPHGAPWLVCCWLDLEMSFSVPSRTRGVAGHFIGKLALGSSRNVRSLANTRPRQAFQHGQRPAFGTARGIGLETGLCLANFLAMGCTQRRLPWLQSPHHGFQRDCALWPWPSAEEGRDVICERSLWSPRGFGL